MSDTEPKRRRRRVRRGPDLPEDLVARAGDAVPGSLSEAAAEVVRVEAFDPASVRPWRFHNRAGSGMDEASLEALAASIARDGQQQLGLARRLPEGDEHAAEVIFGVRRLEACRRAGVAWRAEVCEATVSDAQCATLMHGENAWTQGVSPLENAVQWIAMLDAGVFLNQSELADELGCHRATVSRAVRTAAALFAEDWLGRLVRPVMHQFTGRAAERLADAYADGARRRAARRRAEALAPGEIPADGLHDALFGEVVEPVRRSTVYVRRKTGGGVCAKIERTEAGAWFVAVHPEEQTPTDLAEFAEQVELMLADTTAAAGGVRLGRRLNALLTSEEAKDADRSWLEGCVWAAARASGLDWDRWHSAAAADVLRSQPEGWERAVVRAVGGRDADASGT